MRAHAALLPALCLFVGCSAPLRNPDRSTLTLLPVPAVDRVALDALLSSSPVVLRAAPDGVNARLPEGTLQCDAPTPWDLLRFTREGLPELEKYPPQLLELAGLDELTLCRRLRINGDRIGGLALHEGGGIYLDIGVVSEEPGRLAHLVHHELFHLLDRSPAPGGLGDLAWSRLNPGKIPYAGYAALRGPRQLGFPSPYAMTNPGEDKAETFAFMAANAERMRQLLSDDVVLTRKVARLRDGALARSPLFASVLGAWVDWRPGNALELELAALEVEDLAPPDEARPFVKGIDFEVVLRVPDLPNAVAQHPSSR